MSRKGGGGQGISGFLCHCWQAMGLRGMRSLGRMWKWTPTWSDIMRLGGIDPSAANGGAHAGLVHGTASWPKPKAKIRSPQPADPLPPGRLHQGPEGHPPDR